MKLVVFPPIVILIVYEMGKFLDYASSVGSDLNLFQEIAENFSNNNMFNSYGEQNNLVEKDKDQKQYNTNGARPQYAYVPESHIKQVDNR